MTKKLPKPKKFKGTFEPIIHEQLQKAKRSGKYEVNYESDRISYILNRYYTPDFVLCFPDGHVRYIEAKGYLDPRSITKLIAVKTQYPDIDLRIVFMRNNKVSRSKMTYGDWADKHKIPWAVGKVPKEWLTRT